MSTRSDPPPANAKADAKARLARQLRENLRRRKAQTRARDAADASQPRDEAPARKS